MEVVGLTGGIASGKSTVARMFTHVGAAVLDADQIYHQLISPVGGKPSPLTRSIAAALGEELILSRGQLDRNALSDRVFSDSGALDQLNTITHPAVRAEFDVRCRELAAEGRTWVIYDVPLLFETGLEREMVTTICVWVDPETQVKRLVERDGYTPKGAAARIATQMPLSDKRARADLVIDNSGFLNHTLVRAEEIYAELVDRFEE